MDLKFIWEQAQLAKEKELEVEALKSLLAKSEAEAQRLKDVDSDFKELLGCLRVWTSGDGVYIKEESSETAQAIKEKYNV